VAGSLAVALPQTGCYTYGAAYLGQSVPGTRLALALTDRGRASLSDQIGEGVLQVEGTLLQDSDAAYVVSVASVRSIDGNTRRWGGERIRINHDHVANIRRRDLSRGRTTAAIAAVTVGLTAFILTRNINVFGIGRAPPRDPPDPPTQ
jgi:hypothetical protein